MSFGGFLFCRDHLLEFPFVLFLECFAKDLLLVGFDAPMYDILFEIVEPLFDRYGVVKLKRF